MAVPAGPTPTNSYWHTHVPTAAPPSGSAEESCRKKTTLDGPVVALSIRVVIAFIFNHAAAGVKSERLARCRSLGAGYFQGLTLVVLCSVCLSASGTRSKLNLAIVQRCVLHTFLRSPGGFRYA